MTAYEQGYQDYLNGVQINPHADDENSVEFCEWLEGWLDAAHDGVEW